MAVRTAARLAGSLAVLVIGLAGCGNDNSTTVAPPSADEAAETARALAAATSVQGMCYGWNLEDSSSYDDQPVSRGSGLGPAVPVDSDETRCREYVEIVVRVTYTSASSESSDSASMSVRTNSTRVNESDLTRRLGQMGFESSAFIDEPAFVLLHAVLALPLITAEAGAATPVPATAPSGAPAAAANTPLPSAGNDFLRARLGFLAAAGGMLLAAAALIGLGVWQRRKVKQPNIPKLKPPASASR